MKALLILILASIIAALGGCSTTLPKPVNTMEAIAETETAIAVAARTATELLNAGQLKVGEAERLYMRLDECYSILRLARSLEGGKRALQVIEAKTLLEGVQTELRSARLRGSFPQTIFFPSSIVNEVMA